MNTVRCMWCMSVYVYQPTREKVNYLLHRGPDMHRHTRHTPPPPGDTSHDDPAHPNTSHKKAYESGGFQDSGDARDVMDTSFGMNTREKRFRVHTETNVPYVPYVPNDDPAEPLEPTGARPRQDSRIPIRTMHICAIRPTRTSMSMVSPGTIGIRDERWSNI